MNIPAELFEIKPATPDSYEVAWKLIYDTDPDLFEFYFNDNKKLMKSCLSNWWQRSQGWFSHSSCQAALFNGSLVGIEIGFTRADYQNHTRPTFKYANDIMSRAAFEHFSDAFRNYVPYLFPLIPKNAYYIQSLATKTELRGQGVGKLLLNNAFNRAKEMGLASCQLDVVSGSIAVNFYRKMGMEVLAVTRVPYLEKEYGISMHYRMRKALE